MAHDRELIPRHVEPLVAEALTDTRVVAVNGARQVGKSTLATALTSRARNPVIRLLDDPAMLRAAREAPTDFVEHDGLMVIDEVQLAPELFRAIKLVVDADPTPGQFLLTGSARILALRDLPDALPGRMETVELWPFSQGEIDGTPDRFVDAAFASGPDLSHTSTLRRRDYLERVVRGGYPEAVRRTPRRRAAFFESYLTTLIERDVTELAAIERRGELRRLLALLAGRSGGLLVAASLATQSGIPRTTLNRYLELLAAVFLIKQIPAWSGNHTHRAIGTPKLAYIDSGLASHLLGQDAGRLAEPDGAAGQLMENFVLMELARQLTWNDERVRLYHYRTKDGVEVDAVLEAADGRIVGIEVKAASNVRGGDLAGLRHLAERVGDRFVAGYIFYTGQQTLPYGEKIRALPIEALWSTTANRD
ncbi:ATP-binding protein [Dactylosporangium sp. CA-139114]|uniref:ATP-binding protein n=1 Tax=Dactylosporangium sp. CA-139114 TaxID=3239931 RepID=UPI003D9723A8